MAAAAVASSPLDASIHSFVHPFPPSQPLPLFHSLELIMIQPHTFRRSRVESTSQLSEVRLLLLALSLLLSLSLSLSSLSISLDFPSCHPIHAHAHDHDHDHDPSLHPFFQRVSAEQSPITGSSHTNLFIDVDDIDEQQRLVDDESGGGGGGGDMTLGSALYPKLVTYADDLAEIARWGDPAHHQHPLPSSPDPSMYGHAPPPFCCYGVYAQRGRRPYMEDTHAVYLDHQLHYSTTMNVERNSRDEEEEVEKEETQGGRRNDPAPPSKWAMFGVFDGHGGALASDYTAAYLLPTLHSALLHAQPDAHDIRTVNDVSSSGSGTSPSSPPDSTRVGALPSSAFPTARRNVTATLQSTFESFDDEFIRMVANPRNAHDGSTALVAAIHYLPTLPSKRHHGSGGRPSGRHDDNEEDADGYERERGNIGERASSSSAAGAGATAGVGTATDDEPQFELVVANLGDCRAILVHMSDEHEADAGEMKNMAESLSSTLPPSLSTGLSSSPYFTPLSIDHKPHHSSERSYVESQPGGFVLNRFGVSRVQGILAVSRAIGDAPIKPYVRNIPDVLFQPIAPHHTHADMETTCSAMLPNVADQMDAADGGHAPFCASSASDVMLLASDGFWDVYSSEEAATVVRRALITRPSACHATNGADTPRSPFCPPLDTRPSSSSSSSSSSSHASSHPLLSSVASDLVRSAYLRGSTDNITVMLVHVECIMRWMEEQHKQHTQKSEMG